jgi:purine-binding chemotaxis protein CheW
MLLLVFHLDQQEYALPLEAIERVVRIVEVTPLPDPPPHIAGVFSLYGRVIPVLSLRRRLGLADKALDLNDQFVVVHLAERTLALWVDRATGVFDYPDERVVAARQVLAGSTGLEGMVALPKGIVLIVSLETFCAGAGTAEASGA